ncbi:ArnT family glycosyltransferase [Paenibacillus ginsengihumi]|uniref:ArnT family glycosyltransferase n=1 Tax=Paenibacillus ginsengihumi TaxID=431596 RepID=UPI00036054DA|nr:glycosyltransferase family 39 protein [Paenibacillus ginsengihumi]
MSRHAWLTLSIFAVVFALRLPYLSDSPFEYQSWRQSDTEAIARLFAEHGLGLIPQLNYDGPLPNYAQLELQLTTWLIALLYQAFGPDYALARIVPVAFFMGSAAFVYAIGRLYMTPAAAGWALLLYGILPVNVLFSRAIMPESAALFFSAAAFYLFARWLQERRLRLLLLAAGCLAMTALIKLPAAFIGVAMFLMACRELGRKMLAMPQLWLFAFVSAIPPALYFAWIGRVAEHRFVSGIAAKHIWPKMWSAAASEEARLFFAEQLPRMLTASGLLLGAAGALLLLRERERQPLPFWLGAMGLELAAIVAVIRFDYYLIFLGPPVALCAGYLLARWTQRPGPLGAAAAALAAACLAVQSWHTVGPLVHAQQWDMLRQGEAVRRVAGRSELIVTGINDPSLLNAAQRQGWRLRNERPDDPIGELGEYIRRGAVLFVPLKGYIEGDDGTLRQYLERHYEKREPIPGYPVYWLRDDSPGSWSSK